MNDLFESLYRIYCISFQRKEKSEKNFKWELSLEIIHELNNQLVFKREEDDSTTAMLFGIPIEINYHDPKCMKLWEDVTND